LYCGESTKITFCTRDRFCKT